jgi:hypothetical protein
VYGTCITPVGFLCLVSKEAHPRQSAGLTSGVKEDAVSGHIQCQGCFF